MCTRVGTRPCPVCRSLGWRPPQRGKRRPRPPTHGQLPSLLLKPKNLKKSGPGFIRGRVERAGPKRSRRSAAVTPLRQSWDLFLTFWNLFLTFYVRPIRKPVTPPSKTAQDVGTPDGPHCGRGTGAWALPGPPCRPRPSPASPPRGAAGRTPEAAGRVARLFCSASEGRQAPSSHRVQGGPGPASPAALPVPCCPAFSRPSARVAASRTCHTGSRLAVPSKDSLRRRTPRSDACSVTSSSSGFARMSRSGPTSSTHRNRAGIRVTGGSGAMFFQN